jgi:hypothetical protein
LIRYALECGEEHGFEAWFRSSDDFERQQAAELLSCPVCGSHAVTRALMAPAVSTSRKRAEIAATIAAATPAAGTSAGTSAGQSAAAPAAAGSAATVPALVPTAEPVPAVMADPRAQALAEMLRQLRRHVEENAENVGSRFPEEARKIHYGETDARGIYGQASRDEVEALVEEGIEVHALPILPEDRN